MDKADFAHSQITGLCDASNTVSHSTSHMVPQSYLKTFRHKKSIFTLQQFNT